MFGGNRAFVISGNIGSLSKELIYYCIIMKLVIPTVSLLCERAAHLNSVNSKQKNVVSVQKHLLLLLTGIEKDASKVTKKL